MGEKTEYCKTVKSLTIGSSNFLLLLSYFQNDKINFRMEFISKFVQLNTEIQTIQLKILHDYTITF